MENEQVISALEHMGLERDEAEIYTLLVSLGSATIGKISTLVALSRSKIYGVFDNLLSKGWIKIASDKPKTFVPVDPHEVLSKKQKLISSSYKTALKALSPVYESSKLDISETVTFRGFDVLKKVEEMLGNAQSEINIITAFLPKEAVKKMNSKLIEAKKNGVKIKTIVSNRLKYDTILKDLEKDFDIKIATIPHAGLLIVDDSELLFGSVEEGKEIISTNFLGIWTKNKELIKFSNMIFNQLYKS